MTPDRDTSFTTSSGGLPAYAGAEEMGGRLRAHVPRDLFLAICDRSNHDLGDEDARDR